MSNQELQNKIYSMSNSFLPLDTFFNDIRDNPVENYNKEQAYKDIEKIANFIIDLENEKEHISERIIELEELLKYEKEDKIYIEQQLDQLKQQLEEYKNKENASAVNSWDEMLKNCENCGLNECIGCEYTQTCVQNIKQQLAEKDKEIERLKNLFELNNEVVINQGNEIFDLRVQVLQQKQNQTQLAIQELEKVKELVKDKSAWQSPFGLLKIQESDVEQIIDQQIKELKGEKDAED